MTTWPDDLVSGTTIVRFPKPTRPWQSGVLRHRGLSIRAGGEGQVVSRPWPVGNRGYMVDVRVPKAYVVRRFPLASGDDEPATYRLRCSVRELEVVR